MSLTEITRNCFQSGISAQKWLSLCKQFVAENPNQGANPENVASGISNSVLFLYRSYPGDPALNKYLIHALKDGVLSLPAFVSTFLSAARSSDLHSGATLDFLCDLALKVHDESGLLPLGSLVSHSAPPLSILDTVEDALALIRVSHTMNLNNHHQNLVLNSEKLIFHLLSCVNNVDEVVSVAQAGLLITSISEIANLQLSVQVRAALQGFFNNLKWVTGDDNKVAREAQMMQSMQTYKTSAVDSETDVITLGLLWQYLVVHRAHEWGAGNTPNVVTLLASHWRWTRWSPLVFYTQVFVSAFTCLASCPNLGDPLMWKTFITGRLPSLLSAFQKVVSAEQGTDWRSAVRQGFKSALRRQDLIAAGDHLILQASGPNGGNEGMNGQASFVRSLLQQLVKAELVDQSFAQELDQLVGPSLQPDAQEGQVDLTVEFDARLSQGMDAEDATQWLDRIWRDVNNHDTFANMVLKRFEASSNGNDVEPLSRLCQLLYTHRSALDLVALHAKIYDLVFYALSFLEGYDCETVGDPQGAVSHLGNVVLFLQFILVRYQFDPEAFTKDNRTLSTAFLRQSHEVLEIEASQTAESAAVAMWFKALFDSNSEGIEDSILRSTPPKRLLRISATLFAHAIRAVSANKIDGEILHNGVSYFTGPLLNWTLVGVIKALITQIQLSRNPPSVTFDILQTLITSPSCPQPVLALCSPQVLRYISVERTTAQNVASRKQQKPPNTFDIGMIEDLVRTASRRGGNSTTTAASTGPGGYWAHHPRSQIRNTFSMARNHKIIDLDVDRCLKILDPIKFLQALWSELSAAAHQGEFELCRRVATFVLTMPRPGGRSRPGDGVDEGGVKQCSTPAPTLPLLPIFMHLFLPSLLFAMDKGYEQDQKRDPTKAAATYEMTSSIIASTLTAAFHLEWSTLTVLKDNRPVLGASSSAMAKRLASDFRMKHHGLASQAVLRGLTSSQSFVANFPYFASEH